MLLLQVWTELIVSRTPDVYNPDSYILSPLAHYQSIWGKKNEHK